MKFNYSLVFFYKEKLLTNIKNISILPSNRNITVVIYITVVIF